MLKRALALAIILSVVFMQITVTEAAETLKCNVVFECDFENGVNTDSGRLGEYPNGYIESEDGSYVMKLNSTGGYTSRFDIYSDAPAGEYEATLISMDMKFDRTTGRGYMEICTPTDDGSTPAFGSGSFYRALDITTDGRLTYFEPFCQFTSDVASVRNSLPVYTSGQWYHYDMWLDYDKKAVYYYIDGVEIGTQTFGDDFTGVGAVRMNLTAGNGGAIHMYDNIRIVNFTERGAKVPFADVMGIPENFENPVTIDYKTDEHELGFIFKDKAVDLTATLINVRDDDRDIITEAVVTDEFGNVLTSQEKAFVLASGEETKVTTSFYAEKYGFYYIDTKIKDSDTGEVLNSKRFQFSVMRAAPEGLRNRKLGLVDHTSAGHGADEAARKFELFADAGVGGIRTEYNSPRTSYEDGTYEFLEDFGLPRSLKNAVANDMDQIALLTFGSYPPNTDAEFAEWEKYVTAAVTQITEAKEEGQKIRYEIWNEYNHIPFNLTEEPASTYVKMLQIAYPIIEKTDPSAEVWGFAAAPLTVGEGYKQNAIDWMREVLEAGGGEYMDVASIHTYTHKAPEDFSSNMRCTLIQDTRELLDEYGYEDMKIGISEMGWSTPGDISEEKQGSYIVRWLTMTYNQLGDTYLYVSQDKATEASGENGYGLIRGWTKQFAGDYPLYSAKPAFLAISNYNCIMTDAVFEKEVEKTAGGTYIYQFRLRDGKRAAVVWNSAEVGETVSIKLDAEEVTMYDLYGNPTPLGSSADGEYTFTASGEPVYIIGDFTACERTATVSTIGVFCDYNSKMVTVSGNAGIANGRVGVSVVGAEDNPLNPINIAYMDQMLTDSFGNYSFVFRNIMFEGDYIAKLGYDNGTMIKETTLSVKVPTLLVTSGGEEITSLSQLKAGDEIKAGWFGIRQQTSESNVLLAVAQYKDGVLVSMDAERIEESVASADISTSLKAVDTDCIKIMFWDADEYMPITAAYEIK